MAWKPGARIVGFDDGPFTVADDHVDIVGVVVRAASGYVEAVLHGRVERDGDDATDGIAALVRDARAFPNLVAVLTQNATVAGFNTIDLDRLRAEVERPVLAVSRGTQDWAAMREPLMAGGIAGGAAKWTRIEANAARQIRHRGLTLVPAGMREEDARALVDLSRVRGHLPEPLRLAHLIAAGWVFGQSKGQ